MKDPADLIAKNPQLWINAIKNAKDGAHWKIDDILSKENKVCAAKEALRFIITIKDIHEQEEWIEYVANRIFLRRTL